MIYPSLMSLFLFAFVSTKEGHLVEKEAFFNGFANYFVPKIAQHAFITFGVIFLIGFIMKIVLFILEIRKKNN